MAIILFFLGVAAQDADVEALIGAFTADDAALRERAEKRLVELGLRSRPAMLRLVRDGDPEKASRARSVLRSYPPVVRMEELYEAGFRRETAAALPDFAPRIWSSDPEKVATGVREAGPKANREDLRALASVLEREGIGEKVRQAFADLLENGRDAALASTVTPLLRHPDAYVRERVLRALVAAGAKEQAPAILALLNNKDSVHKALEALEKLAVPVPDESIRGMLDAADESVRFVGVGLARKRDVKAFRAELIQALLAARNVEPWTVADAVARSGPSWKELEPLFDSDHGPTRLAALRLVRKLGLPEAFAAAVRLLDDPFEEAQKEAIQDVVSWRGPEALQRASEGKGSGSLLALARLRAPSAKERALKAITSSEPAMRQAALSALRELDAHDEAGRIAALLGDPAPEVRTEAARILPHLAGDGIGPAIADRLSKEEDPKVQAQLLLAVAETGCAAGAPQVLRLLNEDRERVFWAAAQAAGTLRLKDAVPMLVRRRSYEPLLQLRPENLVDLLRSELKVPPKKEKKEDPLEELGHRSERQQEAEHNDAVLYLLYVSPPGAREFLVECIERGIVPRYPIEEIRFQRAVECFPWLIDRIERGSWFEVSGTGRLLAAWGRRDLAGQAVGWLASGSEGAREAGVELLGGLGLSEKIPVIATLLDSPQTETQWAAWRALSWIGGSETMEIFRRRLRTGTALNRANAALFLGRAGDTSSIPEIEPLLEEDEPGVRLTAADALASMKATGSFDRVARAFKRRTGEDLRTWHWHLVGTGGARGRALVQADLEHSDPEVRKNAMRAMGWGDGFLAEEIQRVESYLHDPDVGSEARESLGRMDPERLLRLAQDPKSRLFLDSVLLERTIGRPRAVPALIRLLEEGDSWHAAQVLGQWGAREAVEPLARALHADGRHLPEYAAVALARIGDARGLELILKLPRRTTPNQGRMENALLSLNGIRHPEAFQKAVSTKWEQKSKWFWTLEEAVTELARRIGMKCTFSKEITDLDRRTPSDWPRRELDLDQIASTWGRLAAFIIEPGEIRVMAPEEALRFWESWAHNGDGGVQKK
jgi:HEAT repeat protein